MPRIVVVGSIHTDLVITAERLPARGETLLGGTFHTFPGGKGANQAVAASRLGGEVCMVGRVGADLYGGYQRDNLAAAGVRAEFVATDPDAASGVALITVERSGDNTIVVATGASGRCAPEDVDRAASVLSQADVLLLQLEIPLETVEHAIHLAAQAGTRVILDPAPARPLPDALLDQVDLLTPNETEAAVLCGLDPAKPADPADLAARLQEKTRRSILLTLGVAGALVATDQGITHVPAVPVTPVDATSAGDTFNGALAVALAEGADLIQAACWASHAASIAVTRLGAQSSIPSRAEVEQSVARAAR
ncbi:MAG TPA: ribokinase [Armatimonadetes bacterium]|jgi:ribokinase|nr:ribokinase [Armatimonadota bacterium]